MRRADDGVAQLRLEPLERRPVGGGRPLEAQRDEDVVHQPALVHDGSGERIDVHEGDGRGFGLGRERGGGEQQQGGECEAHGGILGHAA
jgi:hypothetical protein